MRTLRQVIHAGGVLLATASLLSGCSSGSGPEVDDGTNPAAIDDLSITAFNSTSITLAWTATGDDGDDGTATSYEIRRSGSFLYDGNWETGTLVTGAPVPQPSGSTESMTIDGLTPDETYFFAIRARDE